MVLKNAMILEHYESKTTAGLSETKTEILIN
jgi:hypothetical protein